jgi:FAD/FMN-containing dehydrogenase
MASWNSCAAASPRATRAHLNWMFAIAVTQSQAIVGSPFVIGKNPMPPLDPHCADAAPDGPALTSYDEEHAITYIRMLAADAEGADWRDVARIVLHVDPDDDATRARWAYESHLARSKWVVKHGYRLLLRHGERNRDLSRARS